MTKAKKQELVVANKEATLQFNVKETPMPDGKGLIIVSTLIQKGADGRMWSSTVAGKGVTREAALSDLQANMARKPHAMSAAARRALELVDANIVSPADFVTGKVSLSQEATQEISKRKLLKDKIKSEKLDIKVPFACTNEKLEQLVAEAMKAKTAGTGEDFN